MEANPTRGQWEKLLIKRAQRCFPSPLWPADTRGQTVTASQELSWTSKPLGPLESPSPRGPRCVQCVGGHPGPRFGAGSRWPPRRQHGALLCLRGRLLAPLPGHWYLRRSRVHCCPVLRRCMAPCPWCGTAEGSCQLVGSEPCSHNPRPPSSQHLLSPATLCPAPPSTASASRALSPAGAPSGPSGSGFLPAPCRLSRYLPCVGSLWDPYFLKGNPCYAPP